MLQMQMRALLACTVDQFWLWMHMLEGMSLHATWVAAEIKNNVSCYRHSYSMPWLAAVVSGQSYGQGNQLMQA